MPTSKKRKKGEKSSHQTIEKNIYKINDDINEIVKKIERIRKRRIYLLLSGISPEFVDKVYNDLKTSYKDLNGELDVIVDSGGGDIDAAYNIACLFQKYGNKELTFIIPRWAKSAATLVVCAGDEIVMTDIAELGPLDPQITQINPMEERFEQFSPIHIQTTLDMIRNEYNNGNKDLADGLLKRLQFPLTLGSFLKGHEIAEQYVIRLIKERMEKTGELKGSTEDIANRLAKQYADHGFCINLIEAKKIGLNVREIDGDLLDNSWELYKLFKERERLEKKLREQNITEFLDKLPPEILDKLKEMIKKSQDNE